MPATPSIVRLRRASAPALVAMLLGAAPPLAAQQPSPASDIVAVVAWESAEHARIAAERAQVYARVTQAEVACYQRFAVNDCLARVRGERREVLSDLRRQEVALNDAARKRRASQQLLRIDERVRESGTR